LVRDGSGAHGKRKVGAEDRPSKKDSWRKFLRGGNITTETVRKKEGGKKEMQGGKKILDGATKKLVPTQGFNSGI